MKWAKNKIVSINLLQQVSPGSVSFINEVQMQLPWQWRHKFGVLGENRNLDFILKIVLLLGKVFFYYLNADT